jgi:hypothetical protein
MANPAAMKAARARMAGIQHQPQNNTTQVKLASIRGFAGRHKCLCSGCAASPLTEDVLLNRYDRASSMNGEAEVKYLDGDFRVVRPGAFVRCAITGVAIPLEELKYWSVERQEAYATPEAVLRRLSAGSKA